MGCSSSTSVSIQNYNVNIRTRDGKNYSICYHSLIEHFVLLREVIDNPEMTKEGPVLNYYITDYCRRMSHDKMRTKDQQVKLPWQIEWIWHVHRLHPLAYLIDCNEQLVGGLVDKKLRKLVLKHDQKGNLEVPLSSIESRRSFVPSINLTNAVVRQKDFLDKFQNHYLYFYDLQQLNESSFRTVVQNYVSFIKLANRNHMIVPTFDIDIIWHTHMRYPLLYHEFSIGLCGFILDHDDSIQSKILTDAYQMTADRWKQMYQTEYGQNINRTYLHTSQNLTSCALVIAPIFVSLTTNPTFQGGDCGGGDGGGCDGGGCGGGDGGGCGGGGCGGGCGGD